MDDYVLTKTYESVAKRSPKRYRLDVIGILGDDYEVKMRASTLGTRGYLIKE